FLQSFFQRFFRALARGDIAQRTGHARRLARGIADGLRTIEEPAVTSILEPDAIFDTVERVVLKMVFQRLGDALLVLRVDPLTPLRNRVVHLLFAEPQQLLEAA